MNYLVVQFGILLYKNWFFTFSNPRYIIFIVLPVILTCICIIVMRNAFGYPIEYDKQDYQHYSVEQIIESGIFDHFDFVASPSGCASCTLILEEMKKIIIDMDPSTQVTYIFLDNEEEVEFYFNSFHMFKIFAAISFQNDLKGASTYINATSLHPKIRFPGRLRTARWTNIFNNKVWHWNTYSIYRRQSGWSARPEGIDYQLLPDYHREGALLTLYALHRAIHTYGHETSPFIQYSVPFPRLSFQQFSMDKVNDDVFINFARYFTCPIFLICYSTCIIHFAYYILLEKSEGIKEYLKISGAVSWIFWASWIISFFITLCVLNSLLLITLMTDFWTDSKISAILSYSNPGLIVLFFIFYTFAVVSGITFLTTFFTSVSHSPRTIYIIFMATILPYYFLHWANVYNSTLSVIIICFCLNSIFVVGIDLIYSLEIACEGLSTRNVESFVYINDTFTVSYVICIFAGHTIFYLILLHILDEYFPGIYGVPRKFWKKKRNDDIDNENQFLESKEEEEGDNLKLGISIKNLGKRKKGIVSLKNITMKMYEDQITVLFGYSNSGKSSLTEILTGMISPTSGNVTMAGLSIKTDIIKIRKMLSYCPQKVHLIQNMTAYRNMYIHGKLRGMTKEDIQHEIKYYTKYLQIEDVLYKKVEVLSLEEQIKIQITITFCGGRKILILDEPTCRMDMQNAGLTWDLILSERYARTIVITSKHAEESYALGDRIGILKDGELQTYGTKAYISTSNNLCFYYLCIIKDIRCQCNTLGIKILVNKFMPDAKLEEENDYGIKFALPVEEFVQYKRLFKELDRQKECFGIEDYTIKRDNLDIAYTKSLSTQENKDIFPVCFQKFQIKRLMSYILAVMIHRHFMFTSLQWHLIFFRIFTPISMFLFVPFLFYEHLESLPKLLLNEYTFSPKPIVLLERSEMMYKEFSVRKLTYLQKRGIIVHHVESMVNKYYFNMLKEDRANALYNVLYGIEYINDEHIKCWYNGFTYMHTSALCAVAAYGDTLNDVYFWPFSFDVDAAIVSEPIIIQDGIALSVIFLCAVSMLTIVTTIYYINDLTHYFRIWENICGITPFVYWITAFIWDYIIYIVMVVIFIFCLFIFQLHAVEGDVAIITSYMLCFGFAVFPLIYIMAYIFHAVQNGFLLGLITLMFLGIICSLLLSNVLEEYSFEQVAVYVAFISPYFVLIMNIYHYYFRRRMYFICSNVHERCKHNTDPLMPKFINTFNKHNKTEICWEEICRKWTSCCHVRRQPSKWEYPGVIICAIYFISVGLLCFLTLLIIENKHWRSHKTTRERKQIRSQHKSVVEEKKTIRHMTPVEMYRARIVVKDLTKQYKKQFLINGITFFGNPGDCIVIYGHNGSGKTLLLHSIIGILEHTSGQIYIDGERRKTITNMNDRQFGYSPQATDYLPDDITIGHVLVHTALMRGYSFRDARAISLEMAHYYNLTVYYNFLIANCPLSVKKRIKNAVAFIAQPKVLLFDEPTQGMDPKDKLAFWNNLLFEKEQNACIILTTTDIYECQLLATKLIIMSDGHMVQIGTVPEITSRIVKGFVLNVSMTSITLQYFDHQQEETEVIMEKITTYLQNLFPQIVFIKKYFRTLIYHSPTDESWGMIFEKLNKARENLPISNMTVEEHSLYYGLGSFQKNRNTLLYSTKTFKPHSILHKRKKSYFQ